MLGQTQKTSDIWGEFYEIHTWSGGNGKAGVRPLDKGGTGDLSDAWFAKTCVVMPQTPVPPLSRGRNDSIQADLTS
jgi:hypothetical protein